MVDDQERFELVNVSSGTGSPSLSQTMACKTFVVVVVVIIFQNSSTAPLPSVL